MYKIYEKDDYKKIHEVLSTLRSKELKINNILIEKYEDMNEYLDFEQDIYPRTGTSIYKIGYDFFRLLKWLAYYDRFFYDKKNNLI